MLLLDRNNEPTSTVYYLAALVFDRALSREGIDASCLYREVCEAVGKAVNYDFYLMALDFLYLLDRMSVDERGGLHVHRVAAHS